MTCKSDHTEVPEFLCRACHPELNPTRERLEEAERQDRQERQVFQTRQDLIRARQALTRAEAAATRGGNAGIETRKALSLRAKVERLEKELQLKA